MEQHEARAVAAIVRAFRDIPYYVQKGRTPPDDGAPLSRALAGVPLLLKRDLRVALPRQWLPKGRDAKAELASGAVELVETSGTEERMRVLWDKGWWLAQRERAMRTNALVARALDGAFGPWREALLTTPSTGMRTCNVGDLGFDDRLAGERLLLNQRPDPTYWQADDMDRMLDEIARHGTVGLDADPAYLAMLARRAATTKRKIEVKGFVVLGYAFATRPQLRAIRRVYAGPIFQMYAASEVGALFMEGEDGVLRHVPATTHVELLPAKVPTPGAEGASLVVATTLDREAQPLVRFVVGDLVRPGGDGAVTSIEGRLQDALLRPDGALVTAGAIDRALEAIDTVADYQANQPAADRVEVDVVVEADADVAATLAGVRAALAPLVEGIASFDVRSVTGVAAEASGRFRSSRRHFPLDLERSFATS